MVTRTELITFRDLKQKNSCNVPCLYCGSDEKYVCTLTSADQNYIEVDCHCSACGNDWVDCYDAEGNLKDIRLPNIGFAWEPKDIK